MNMLDKIAGIWPEIAILIGAVISMILGLSGSRAVRRAMVWVAGLSLVVAAALVACRQMQINASHGAAIAGIAPPAGDSMVALVKVIVCFVGIILLLVAASVPDELDHTRHLEAGREAFDPGLVMRGEFYAFFLFSLVGVMLAAGAGDLIWLFLALELTSLPTYVMVATGRDRIRAQEAGVKYFFLGALAAAVFLYGFTLIYGATGQTEFGAIRQAIARDGLNALGLTGFVLALVGIAFKIAAFPMHFYTADVYEGAPTPVTAFLAFVPKTAGFVSLILLLSLLPTTAAGGLPREISWLIWIMAAATMTVGNVLGLLQTNVKRVLAYSSIAHTGYMLVGLLALNATTGDAVGNGAAAILFYLVAYGLATIGAFAVLGSLQVRGEEAQTFDDISGLSSRNPGLAAIMLLCVLSLIGLPPLVGFLGKIYLFGSAIAHSDGHPEYIWLVVIAVVNSAVSAVYYLRIVGAMFFGDAAPDTTACPGSARRIAAAVAAIGALVLGIAGGPLVNATRDATQATASSSAAARAADPLAQNSK